MKPALVFMLLFVQGVFAERHHCARKTCAPETHHSTATQNFSSS